MRRAKSKPSGSPVFVKAPSVTKGSDDITDRKQAEEALRDSERRFRALVETSGEGIAVASPKGPFTYVNQRMADMLGYPVEEIIGKSALDFCPDDWKPHVIRIRKELQKGGRLSGEFKFLRKDGSVLWSMYNASSLADDNGELVEIFAMHTDITGRKRAEEALKESEERLVEAQALAHLGSFQITSLSEPVKWSAEMYLITGRDPSLGPPTVAEYAERYVHPEDREGVGGRTSRLFDEGGSIEVEYRVIRPDGSIRFVSSIGRAEMDTSGHVVRIFGTLQDITARKHAEEQVRLSQETFFELVERAPFGIYIVDSEFRISHMNLGSQEGAFVNVRPVIGRPFAEAMHTLWPEDVAEEIIGYFRHTLETGEPYYSPRFVNPRHDTGTVESYEWELHRILLPDGQNGVICYYFDSTKIREAEEAIREKNEDLTRAEKELRQARDMLEERVRERTAELETALGKIRTERRRLFDVLETVPFMVCLLTPDYHVAFANKTFREQFGESGGRHCYEYCYGKSKPCEFCESFEVLRTGKPHHWEVVTPDGRIISANDYPFTDTDGSPKILEMDIDITEQRRAEEAVQVAMESARTERRRLYDVLETLPVYVCLLDKDYRMPFANKYFRDTFGYSDARPCHDFLFGLDRPCDNCETYTVMQTKAPHHWFWTGPNGRDYSIYDFPFNDTDGSFLILEMGIDITEQKRAEEALIAARDQLENRVKERTAELLYRNTELAAANAEITAAQEELQENNEELSLREIDLSRALEEKEALLSEIHHRVKNNLTAFISLLSLEGAYDDTPAGIAMKTDLQNRARSMALIHETLYRTRNFSQVDMQVYLTTLVGQIVASYGTALPSQTIIDAGGITLDLARATPLGLIVNELVTNSLKYAFPAPPDGGPAWRPPSLIAVGLTRSDGSYVLTVRDNGIGLPAGVDPIVSKTLGLKLVNFLARHQLRAKITAENDGGASFRFIFPEKS